MRLPLSAALLLVGAAAAPAKPPDLDAVNRQLAGRVVDYTANHGRDNRLPSAVLGMKRDLYVYLPPGFCPTTAYPLLLWFHGGFGDEHAFLDTASLPVLDRLIRCGCVPPMIVACPDGTYSGRNGYLTPHSLYANGCGGRVEDHVMTEVVPFLLANYPVLPQREAHAVGGASAGGMGAVSLALKHRQFFGAAASVSGALNVLYDTCRHDYFDDFHPATFRWRTTYDPRQVVGLFLGGAVKIRARQFIEPVFGTDPGVIDRVRTWNPATLLETTNLQPGELKLFARWGGKDNLNFDAQGASFVWLANRRGVDVAVEVDPEADHGNDTFRAGSVRVYRWLATVFPPPAPVTPPPAAAPAPSP